VFEVGTLLAGKYRVDRVIGRGGMGVVVAATHLHLQQPVALKFLLPGAPHSREVMERFVREARSAARLRSEHVCRVSDVGSFDDGSPYIVMELLEGSDLATLLQQHGLMPVQGAAVHVLQACAGIAEAHALGIVHRDLKPANLFLTRRPDGTPLIKVLDFGIAKAQSDQDFSLTQTSAVLGSPGYMSPEQLRSTRDVDVRSDIWAIGVVLYELVAGRPPFVAETITELALRIAMDPPPPLVGRMPQGFDQVVDRCLAKDPAQRYPDLANLAHALAAYAGTGGWELANAVSRMLHVSPSGGQPSGPIGYPVTVAMSYPSTPTTMGSAASSMLTAPRRRWGVIGAAAAAALIAGTVMAVAMRGGDGPRAASAPSGSEASAAGAAETPSAPAAAPPAPAAAAVAEPPAAVASPPAAAAAPPPAAVAPPAAPAAAPPPAAAAPPPAAAAPVEPSPPQAHAAEPPPAVAKPSSPATVRPSASETRPAPGKPGKPARPAKDTGRRRSEPKQPEDYGESRF
jgi:serine/threonine-protein kinase